jgi:heme oxygenase
MVAENATWGAARVHGELSMLGFEVSERTVSRWMRSAPRNPKPAQRWRAFLSAPHGFPQRYRMIANAWRNCDDTYDDNDDSFGTKTDKMG